MADQCAVDFSFKFSPINYRTQDLNGFISKAYFLDQITNLIGKYRFSKVPTNYPNRNWHKKKITLIISFVSLLSPDLSVRRSMLDLNLRWNLIRDGFGKRTSTKKWIEEIFQVRQYTRARDRTIFFLLSVQSKSSIFQMISVFAVKKKPHTHKKITKTTIIPLASFVFQNSRFIPKCIANVIGQKWK